MIIIFVFVLYITDALLADLQSTTHLISNYQQQQQGNGTLPNNHQGTHQSPAQTQGYSNPPAQQAYPNPPAQTQQAYPNPPAQNNHFNHTGYHQAPSPGGPASGPPERLINQPGVNSEDFGQGPRTVVRKSDSSHSSRGSTPPLPPPPAQELLDSVQSYQPSEVSTKRFFPFTLSLSLSVPL